MPGPEGGGDVNTAIPPAETGAPPPDGEPQANEDAVEVTGEAELPEEGAEHSDNPEVTREQQETEITGLASLVVQTRVEEIGQKKPEEVTEADAAVRLFNKLVSQQDGSYVDEKDGRKCGLDIGGDNPLTITQEVDGKNQDFDVIHLASVSGDTFTCYVREAGTLNTTKPVAVSRADLVRAHLDVDGEKILSSFEGNKRVIMDQYAEMVKTGELPKLEAEESTALNETIQKVLEEEGIPSVGGFAREMAQSVHQQVQAEKGATAEQIGEIARYNQQQQARVKEFMETLKGKNELDADDFIRLLESTGKKLDNLDLQLKQAVARAEELQELLKIKNGQDYADGAETGKVSPQKRRQWEDELAFAEATQDLLARKEPLLQMLKNKITGGSQVELSEEAAKWQPETIIRNAFAKLKSGEIPTEARGKLMDAMRTGDLEAVAKAEGITLPKDLKESAKKISIWKKCLDKLKFGDAKTLKLLGGGAVLLLLLALVQGGKE